MRAPQEPTVEPWGHQCLRVHKQIAASNGNQEEVGKSMETGEGLLSDAAARKLQAVVAKGLGSRDELVI